MLSEKEEKFIKYWTESRDKEASFSRKLIVGLPMALIFTLPILLLIIVVFIFLPDWYSKIGSSLKGVIITVVIALLISTIFIAVVRQHFMWEQKEAEFQRLLIKKAKG